MLAGAIFETIAKILKTPKAQVLVLLPEIALTGQWLERFRGRFGVSDAARARGAEILGEIKGYATGFDSSRGANNKRAAKAASRTLKQALSPGFLQQCSQRALCWELCGPWYVG